MLSPLVKKSTLESTPALATTSLALFCATLLAACGGGGGGGGAAADAGPVNTVAAASGSVLYSGPVTGLGSIIVNGVRFETIGAKVHDSDDPYGAASYADPIKLGMTVSVEGSADEAKGTGTASAIRLDGGIRGQVRALDMGANTFAVNGQIIKADPKTTVFQGAKGLADLAASSWVEVYGLPRSDGTFLATRIEAYVSRDALASNYPNASAYPVSLRGVVAASGPNTFTLSNGANGTITVSYRAADVLPAGAAISAGSSVRVLASSVTDSLSVAAGKVRVLDPSALLAGSSAPSAANGVSVKLKGVVDSVADNSIVLSGTTVLLASTARANGMPVKGQVVEVSALLSNGSLIAGKLEFEDRQTTYTAQPGGTSAPVSYRQELYGTVSGYASGGNTFVVQGVTVKVDSATRYEYGYSTLADNMYLEVKGVLQNGVLLASKVDLKGATASGSTGSISSVDGRSSRDDQLSSGGNSFEVYGTLTCGNYPVSCSIAAGTGNTLKTNLSAAGWSAEHGGFVAGTPLSVEAKGYLDNAGVFQVSKIERKN